MPPLDILKLCNNEMRAFVIENLLQHSDDLDYIQDVLNVVGWYPDLTPTLHTVLAGFNRRRISGSLRMDISPLSWTGYDSHTWLLLTIITVAYGIEGSKGKGVLFQGSAISTSWGGVALIQNGADTNTNALFMARSRTEHFLAQKGGGEKSLQKEVRRLIREKEIINEGNSGPADSTRRRGIWNSVYLIWLVPNYWKR